MKQLQTKPKLGLGGPVDLFVIREFLGHIYIFTAMVFSFGVGYWKLGVSRETAISRFLEVSLVMWKLDKSIFFQ